MALSEVTTTFNVHDYFGGDFDARRIKGWATNNADDQTIHDNDTGETRIGSARATIASDGTGTFTHWAPGADANPASWQTTYHFDAPDPSAPKGRRRVSLGPFTVTASGLMTALVEEQDVPATYLTTVTTVLDGYVDDAAASAAAAAASAALAEDISGIATPDGVVSTLIDNPASDTAASLTAAYVGRSEVVIKAEKYGVAEGNSAAANDAAIAAALTAAGTARQTLGVRNVIVEFGRGRFLANPFSVPGSVSIYGQDQEATQLVNDSTAGNDVFLHMAGSRARVRGITVDGQRAAQAIVGLSAVQFSRPNNLSRAGGVALTANVAANATTMTISTASPGGEPILPGEAIKLVEGAAEEVVYVADTYTVGSTTIPLRSPIVAAFTTAAYASVAVTDVDCTDSVIYSNGRDCVAFWHAIGFVAERCTGLDFEDTAFDVPSAGSRDGEIRFNRAVGMGRWGVCFDTAETEFGRVADCTSRGNKIKFLPGGSGFISGGATDAVQIGVSERVQSIDDTADLRLAGISGFRLGGNTTDFPLAARIINPTVLGPATPRAGTAGVRSTLGAANTLLSVHGGDITGMETAIQAETIRRVQVIGTRWRGHSGHGFTITADASNAQFVQIVGTHSEGGVNGIRFGGTPHASNKVTTTACFATGFSFASVTADGGWNKTDTANIP